MREKERNRQTVHTTDHGVASGVVHTTNHCVGVSVDGAQSCPFDIGLIGFRDCLCWYGTGEKLMGSGDWLGESPEHAEGAKTRFFRNRWLAQSNRARRCTGFDTIVKCSLALATIVVFRAYIDCQKRSEQRLSDACPVGSSRNDSSRNDRRGSDICNVLRMPPIPRPI